MAIPPFPGSSGRDGWPFFFPHAWEASQRTKMWKLGVVSYLNSLPLYRPLEARGEVEIVRVVPSLLANIVDSGQCDAALLPIVDHLRGHGDGLVSDAIIGATGFVRSVLMFSKVPPDRVRTIAADTSSHTSVALLRVLLRDLYGLEPAFREAAPNLESMLRDHDAALIIGDPALVAVQHPGDLHVFDLATAWQELTGLPFVFAAWTKRRGLDEDQTAELAAYLNAARNEGTGSVAQIVRENPTGTKLTAEVVTKYLDGTIQYTLTERHRAGMEEFRRRLGL